MAQKAGTANEAAPKAPLVTHSVTPSWVTGRLVPIRHTDRARVLDEVWAVRGAGGVPLVGDDRWDDEFWTDLTRGVEESSLAPDIGWATFSSGSSGSPRVILRTDESWSASFDAVSELLQLDRDDTVLLPAPLASSLSLFSVAHARSVGAAVRLPRVHALGAGDLDGVTVSHCTPTALGVLVDAIERGAVRTLRAALVGGAHLDPALRERAEVLGLRIVSYYGAAELSFVAVDDDGTGFRPFPGVEVRVVDGELWAKSPYLAHGYLGGSAGALRVDAEGWATVGDRAELNPERRIHLRGRRDDAILTAGATAVPHDIEAALRSIDGVRDAVVFAIPISDTDSLVGAVVELRTDARGMSLRELRAQASTRLVASHLPRRWFWTDSLERTVSGKVARARIRADALEGKLARLE